MLHLGLLAVICFIPWAQAKVFYDVDLWIPVGNLLSMVLAPAEATWCSASWPTRFHLWMAFYPVLRWMEGVWRIFSFWLSHWWIVPALSLHFLSTVPLSHPTPRQDVRFWIPISLQVQINLGGMSAFWRPRRSKPHFSKPKGVRVRIRYVRLSMTSIFDALISSLLRRLRRVWYHVRKKFAPSRVSAIPVDNPWLSTFNRAVDPMARGFHSTQYILDHQAQIDGHHPKAVQTLLRKLPPLKWFQQEMAMHCKLLGLESEARSMEQAFIAAVELQDELNMTRPPTSLLSGAYISDHDSSNTPIVFDTGASFSVTPIATDFVSKLETPHVSHMSGLSNSVKIKGVGWVEWPVRDVFGRIQIVRTRAYYVPVASIRLFSPQNYFQETKSGKGEFDHESLTFTTANGHRLQFPYHPGSNLPLMYVDWDVPQAGLSATHYQFLESETAFETTTQLLQDNHNLSPPAKELLLWHNRLGHAGFRWIQSLMRVQKQNIGEQADPPLIPTVISNTPNCALPRCAACQLGKQHRRTPKSARTLAVPDQEMAIRREDLNPGDCVSIDQYSCYIPGRLPHTFGREPIKDRYKGGTIFVDHASTYMSVHHQISLGMPETLVGKHLLEKEARNHGFHIKAYRADNKPFAAEDFTDDIALQDQDLTFSGVGAHHQNGVAERALQTTVTWARAMMMHQLIHWPTQFDAALWPFAMEHAVYLWNNMPKERHGLTPAELFSGIKSHQDEAITRARIWGCPVYVLDPKLQDGKKIPKWSRRSRLGVYLGVSPTHSSTVGRILHPETGHISPQYHVVYDELFQTVPGSLDDGLFDSNLWNSLLALGGLEQTLDPTDTAGNKVPYQELFDDYRNLSDTSVPEGDDDDSVAASECSETSVSEGAPIAPLPDPGPVNEGADGSSISMDPQYRTRSGRRVTPNPRYAANFLAHEDQEPQPRNRPDHVHRRILADGGKRNIRPRTLHNQFVQGLDWTQSVSMMKTRQGRQAILELSKDYDAETETQEDWSPLAFAAKAADADGDTLSYSEAMNHPSADGFWKAAKQELDTLDKFKVWDEVPRESWMNVLPSTWAFRIKRFPTGAIRKLKARFCACGYRQIQNVDYFETYAPVVSWTTVRLLLILSIELGLATTQVDYTAAFVHAEVERPPNYDTMSPEEQRRQGVFCEMPKGFAKPGTVLRLKKSLYGLKNSPLQWFKFLSVKLEACGLRQMTEIDPCLFISDTVICLVYVDDTLFFAKNEADINTVLDTLRSMELTLEKEDDVAGFLGVHIRRDQASGEMELTQVGLTDRIIEALGVQNMEPVDVPATHILGKDQDGDPADCSFNYASVIGMLWYLYGHSRPDLGFAVSQAARFAFDPKRSHELALIQIGQYLLGTREKGLILKPMATDHFEMDVFVDADFMGLYGKELRSDPANVKSRTGFVICLNGCPIIWSSKLQESIALSTMMAEYYALSTAMREVIPLRRLVETVAHGCGMDTTCLTTFKTTVWEDNSGALALANLEPGQHTARSKFYDVKVHWFRSHLKPNNIVVKKIGTAEQKADIFTKPLSRETFNALRLMLLGW